MGQTTRYSRSRMAPGYPKTIRIGPGAERELLLPLIPDLKGFVLFNNSDDPENPVHAYLGGPGVVHGQQEAEPDGNGVGGGGGIFPAGTSFQSDGQTDAFDGPIYGVTESGYTYICVWALI